MITGDTMNADFQSAVVRLNNWLMPLMRSRTGVLLFGTLLGGPHLLFLLLAVGVRLHLSWSVSVREDLSLALAMLALAACLFYGFFSVLLILWRLQSSVFVPDLKTVRLLLSYTLMPVIYGLLAGWGLQGWVGHYSSALLRAALLLYATYWVGTSALIFKIALNRTLEARQEAEAKTCHVPQSLAELKPRRQPPPGKTAMQMIQGQWPGEETTEQLLAQLKAQDGTIPNDDTHDKSDKTEAAANRPDHD